MNDKAKAVIEEALREAWKDGNAHELDAVAKAGANWRIEREAPAVLQRVLAALGGEPVAWMYREDRPDGTSGKSLTFMRWPGYEQKVRYAQEVPLYAAPPIGSKETTIDIAAIRALAEVHVRRGDDCGVLARGVLRAIGGAK